MLLLAHLDPLARRRSALPHLVHWGSERESAQFVEKQNAAARAQRACTPGPATAYRVASCIPRRTRHTRRDPPPTERGRQRIVRNARMLSVLNHAAVGGGPRTPARAPVSRTAPLVAQGRTAPSRQAVVAAECRSATSGRHELVQVCDMSSSQSRGRSAPDARGADAPPRAKRRKRAPARSVSSLRLTPTRSEAGARGDRVEVAVGMARGDLVWRGDDGDLAVGRAPDRRAPHDLAGGRIAAHSWTCTQSGRPRRSRTTRRCRVSARLRPRSSASPAPSRRPGRARRP